MHLSLVSVFEFQIRRCTSRSPRCTGNVNLSFHVGAVPPSRHTLVRNCAFSPHLSTTYGSCFPNVCVSASRIALRTGCARNSPRGEIRRRQSSSSSSSSMHRRRSRVESRVAFVVACTVARRRRRVPFTSSFPRVMSRGNASSCEDFSPAPARRTTTDGIGPMIERGGEESRRGGGEDAVEARVIAIDVCVLISRRRTSLTRRRRARRARRESFRSRTETSSRR